MPHSKAVRAGLINGSRAGSRGADCAGAYRRAVPAWQTGTQRRPGSVAKFWQACYRRSMSTMNISLPDELKAFVDRRIKAEAYGRSEEHTSELQSLMRISYAVFCLKKKQ